jgi:hypothetical protein
MEDLNVIPEIMKLLLEKTSGHWDRQEYFEEESQSTEEQKQK